MISWSAFPRVKWGKKKRSPPPRTFVMVMKSGPRKTLLTPSILKSCLGDQKETSEQDRYTGKQADMRFCLVFKSNIWRYVEQNWLETKLFQVIQTGVLRTLNTDGDVGISLRTDSRL